MIRPYFYLQYVMANRKFRELGFIPIAAYLLFGVLMVNCGKLPAQIIFVSADSLIVNVDNFVGKKVETEGYIAHVCGVDGMKMKLMSENDEVVVIVPQDTTRFDLSLNRKRVRVFGIVKEERISEEYINAREEEKVLICHVDRTPCKDKDWIEEKTKAGAVETLSKRHTDAMRQKMEQQGKRYLSIISIICEKHEVVETNE